VLAYTDAMTKEVHVPDNIFNPLRQHFNDREIVELTATIAAYNLVSRFLEALQIDPEK
jgi:alkylhydroperoxidase family enzyme